MHLNTQKLFRELKDDRGSDRGVGRRLRDTIVSPGLSYSKDKRLGRRYTQNSWAYIPVALSSD